MFYRMLKNALTRRKSRLFMIAFTMALGVSLATAMLNVMMDIGDKVNQELKTYGANLTVVPRGASLVNELYELDDEAADESGYPAVPQKYLAEEELPNMKMIFWAYNIVDFAPFLEMSAIADKTGQPVQLVGTWFEKHLDLPTGESVDTGMKHLRSWWDINGEWASASNGRDTPPEAMVGANLAEKLGLKTGDVINVSFPEKDRHASLAIRGIFHSGGSEDDQIFTPLDLVQRLSDRPGLVQRVDVSALTTPENELARRAAQDPSSLSRKEWDTWYCTAYISSIAYQIEEVISDSRAKPVLQVAESEGAILQKTQLLMMFLTILSMLCAALAISNLVTAGVMERSAEIGLLKALGATNMSVSLLIMAEILFIAVLGAIAGYFVGLGFAQIIGQTVFGSVITTKAIVIPLVAILVLLVTALGSLPAVRMLLSLRPTEVLHGR